MCVINKERTLFVVKWFAGMNVIILLWQIYFYRETLVER